MDCASDQCAFTRDAGIRPLIIISGGQSGVDRAALDAAIAFSIAYGGWCPKGGWAEDFPDPPGLLARYPLLKETPLADPAQRTQWNVRDSDATLILVVAHGFAVSAGTALTFEFATREGKPLLILNLDQLGSSARAKAWLADLLTVRGTAPFRLNIAGSRGSEARGIYAEATAFLREVLAGFA